MVEVIKVAIPKEKIKRCPLCLTEMGKAPETRDVWVCPECMVHEKNGELYNVDRRGNLRKSTNLEEKKQYLETMSIAVWFNSKDKKQFDNITEMTHRLDGWMILVRVDGKEIIINKHQVNFIEEV